ncbi:MAG: hypothetical protein ACJ8AK_02915 [Gemmatimonadaceae bacterium]
MCDICAKRKADIALFLSEHAPQLGIKSAAAQVAWSDLNALAIESTQLPLGDVAQLKSQGDDISSRAGVVMDRLALHELEEIRFAAAVLSLTGDLHGNATTRVIKRRWRDGEGDEQLTTEAVASVEQSIAQEDFNTALQKQIARAVAGVLSNKEPAPAVTVFVPGNGKPVPPA